MSQPSNALLIPSPVRPNDLNDSYPSAFAVDIRGGLHSVETISQRNDISNDRREWGMLCSVYNNTSDISLNGIYQLQYGKSNTDIADDANWSKLNISSLNSAVGEWASSVSSYIDTPPGITPSNGTRFLVATPSFSGFINQGDKIAEYDITSNSGFGGYLFTTPTDGTTLRVDNELNLLYKFSGTWGSGGSWTKEYLNQIRYISPTSSNGTSYNFITDSSLTKLDSYSYSIYFANFGITNSGPSTLNIDSLGTFSIKKFNGTLLTDVDANDLIPNIRYQLGWNNGNFLLYGFGGSNLSLIGPAEDGTYSDGLFTDFTPTTPVGTPIDRFNEILKELVPPSAPVLSDWSLYGPSFVSGKLSFDITNDQANGLSAAPGFSIGSIFNSSGKRKGINSFYLQPNTGTTYYSDYLGVLNPQVGTPSNMAYESQSFGNGITGSLVMSVNGTTVSTVNLGSTFGAIDNTSSGSITGISVTAATSSKFPNGTPYESLWSRKGSFVIKNNDPRLRPGFNYIDFSHILPSSTLTLGSYSWVSDPGTFSTSFVESIINITTNTQNAKNLSGIKFWNAVTFTYRVIYSNHVKNTFNTSNASISLSASTVSGVNGFGFETTTTTPYVILPQPIGITSSGPNSTQQEDYNISLKDSVRRLNEPIQISTSVLRTVQNSSADSSAGVLDTGWMIDNYPQSSTDGVEKFEDEEYRILNLTNKYNNSYNSTSNVINTSNKWVSSNSLFNTTGYTNGLQVIGGRLIYPISDFSSIGDPNHNPNFQNGDTNYVACNQLTTGHSTTDTSDTNYRTFTRWFRVTPVSTNFSLVMFNISHTQTSFISPNVPLSGNNCWIEVKLPWNGVQTPPTGLVSGNSVTGWLDMTKPFVNGQWSNGNGAYTRSIDPPTASGQNWIVDFGQGKGTIFSSGYVLLRITAPSSWTGAILGITFSGTT